MNRKDIVTKLISEGLSANTLVGLNDKQLNALSIRFLGEERNSNVYISKQDPDLTNKVDDAKEKDKTIETYEGDVTEGDGSLPGLSVKGSSKPKTPKKTEVKKNDIEDETPNKEDTNEEDEPKKEDKKLNKKERFKEFLKKKLNKKSGDDDEDKEEIKEWVDQLVQTDKKSVTTKDEIMGLINTKLEEQMLEPDIAEPRTKPGTRPGTDRPEKSPDRGPYRDPWKEPGKGPDPAPKMEGGDTELPDFLTFDKIINSANENRLNEIATNVLNELKSSKSKNLKDIVSKILSEIKNQ